MSRFVRGCLVWLPGAERFFVDLAALLGFESPCRSNKVSCVTFPTKKTSDQELLGKQYSANSFKHERGNRQQYSHNSGKWDACLYSLQQVVNRPVWNSCLLDCALCSCNCYLHTSVKIRFMTFEACHFRPQALHLYARDMACRATHGSCRRRGLTMAYKWLQKCKTLCSAGTTITAKILDVPDLVGYSSNVPVNSVDALSLILQHHVAHCINTALSAAAMQTDSTTRFKLCENLRIC